MNAIIMKLSIKEDSENVATTIVYRGTNARKNT
jgi:hypothetical protein